MEKNAKISIFGASNQVKDGYMTINEDSASIKTDDTALLITKDSISIECPSYSLFLRLNSSRMSIREGGYHGVLNVELKELKSKLRPDGVTVWTKYFIENEPMELKIEADFMR